MKYTQAEKERIYANLDAIKAYIEREIQPRITSQVTVDFGETKSYADWSREKEFHIYVYPEGIRGRIGGLGISFEKNPADKYEPTAYKHLDFAVGLIREWQSVKAILITAVQNEAETRNAINNFEV